MIGKLISEGESELTAPARADREIGKIKELGSRSNIKGQIRDLLVQRFIYHKPDYEDLWDDESCQAIIIWHQGQRVSDFDAGPSLSNCANCLGQLTQIINISVRGSRHC